MYLRAENSKFSLPLSSDIKAEYCFYAFVFILYPAVLLCLYPFKHSFHSTPLQVFVFDFFYSAHEEFGLKDLQHSKINTKKRIVYCVKRVSLEKQRFLVFICYGRNPPTKQYG
ncbi:unnamed protein product [Ceratitis capitata]|uniref:(Mediterranean fruit fly) hypothetical protein n=1 Tax=Ceratitis capitata TaxID=7213 RepID=A0A811U1P6_CERCA|nr:unnamed protein product [Ceratitis capitata]